MTETRSTGIINKNVKIFKDLDEEIIQTGKCCACGACVAYCESQSFDVIKMDRYTPKFKSDKTMDNCTECGVCYYICSQNFTLLSKMNEVYNIKDEIGNIIDIKAAKTSEKGIEAVSQDGGIVTTILAYLFDKHKIDAAIVSEFDENLNPNPKIIYNKEDLLKSAGTRYSISSQILPLKDLYNISQDILEKKGIFDIEQLKIAFVGTPCQTRGIAKMKFLHLKPAHVVKYIIGLFCFENFNYDLLYEILKKETNVSPEDIKKTWIKKNFFISDKEGNQHEVNIKILDPAVRSHCHECYEFTGKYSDISVGASGAPKGYSMILTRTQKGEDVINSLISHSLIKQFVVPIDQTKEWETKKINWLKKMTGLKRK
jgi:coenzyme F420-reducing hydrogenase beta subunit